MYISLIVYSSKVIIRKFGLRKNNHKKWCFFGFKKRKNVFSNYGFNHHHNMGCELHFINIKATGM